jgi:polyribonucleotide nucleotidyltransferase
LAWRSAGSPWAAHAATPNDPPTINKKAINPTVAELEESELDLVLAGRKEILQVDLAEAGLDDAVDAGLGLVGD